jgi:hypothetical protein
MLQRQGGSGRGAIDGLANAIGPAGMFPSDARDIPTRNADIGEFAVIEL